MIFWVLKNAGILRSCIPWPIIKIKVCSKVDITLEIGQYQIVVWKRKTHLSQDIFNFSFGICGSLPKIILDFCHKGPLNVLMSTKLHLKSPITLSQPWGWLCPQNIHQPCLLCILSAMEGLVLLNVSHFGQSCTSQPLAAPRDIAEPETGFAMSISLILGPEHLAANCFVEARVWCILEGWSPPGNLMST